MKIVFTKGRGKHDRMEIVRDDGSREILDCPKQRIIPHEMVHHAVESTLHRRGFMWRVAAGEAAALRMKGTAESDGVERLVEVFQGDAWSGGSSAVDEMLDLYQVTCAARACPPLPVAVADMEAIRQRIEQLDREWQPVPVDGSIELHL